MVVSLPLLSRHFTLFLTLFLSSEQACWPLAGRATLLPAKVRFTPWQQDCASAPRLSPASSSIERRMLVVLSTATFASGGPALKLGIRRSDAGT
ncbi:hypothetical protein KCP70_15670 [Salmonella enterica subsp. enterica]|nr:hypothetical protein KCP70_15670 [Salmonella enterica subsp. enterica]